MVENEAPHWRHLRGTGFRKNINIKPLLSLERQEAPGSIDTGWLMR
jgi:hypothetical protein